MHISYSAINDFRKCPFSYKLKFIDKVQYDRQNLFSVFGKSIHETIEQILLNKTDNVKKTFKSLFQHMLLELSQEQKEKIFKNKNLIEILKSMSNEGPFLCESAIEELKRTFPGFQIIHAEMEFIEPLTEYEKEDYEFKGIIDLIIKTPDNQYHILDWKTCSWGWESRKKNDKWVTYQLTYYKHFFSLQQNIDFKNIKTYFALLKRTAKNKRIEIFDVPVGEKKVKNALKVLNNILYNVDKRNFIKNRLSCDKCEFYKTIYCP